MPTDRETALLLERHLGECEMRNAEVSRLMAEAKTQRERMEGKIDALIIDRAAEKAGVKMALAIFGGLATAAGVVGGVVAKWLSR